MLTSRYSALKMDGKPLYEYARSNTPLPRPIPTRRVTVHALELIRYAEEGEHEYRYPKEQLGDKEKDELARMERMAKEGGTGETDEQDIATEKEGAEAVEHVEEVDETGGEFRLIALPAVIV